MSSPSPSKIRIESEVDRFFIYLISLYLGLGAIAVPLLLQAVIIFLIDTILMNLIKKNPPRERISLEKDCEDLLLSLVFAEKKVNEYR